MTYTVGSLFSGIGGLDLGVERAGMTVAWQSEIDPYCCRVLAKHWPNVPNLGDIKTIDWNKVEPVDLICGGYPCQPFSLAGARNGTDDPRHLWPYMRDAIRVVRPRLVLLENVPGHLSLGFGTVLGDLAGLGYDCEWDCIPAAAVGAPHLRYRVFVVAHAREFRRLGRAGVAGAGRDATVGSQTGDHAGDSGAAHVAHANGESEPGVPIDAVTRPGLVVPHPGSHELRQQPVGVRRGGGAPVVGDDGPNGHVADADCVARKAATAFDHQRRGPGRPRHRTGPRPQFDRDGWWAVEPDVGVGTHGLSTGLDGGRVNVDANEDSASATVCGVWRDAEAQEVHDWSAGGLRRLQEAPLLRSSLHGTSLCQAHLAAELEAETGYPVPWDDLRSVWGYVEAHGPSRRRESGQRLAVEHPDLVRELSCIAPPPCSACWADGSWESGLTRVATGVPHRVDRLRALGNAVVPQVAEWIGRRIMEVAA